MVFQFISEFHRLKAIKMVLIKVGNNVVENNGNDCILSDM